jgi:HK97 family phage major capsid protein
MRSKDLRAERAKLITDARALVDKANPSAEDSAKFDAMMAESDNLKAQIDRVERMERDALELNAAQAAAPGGVALPGRLPEGVTQSAARDNRIALARYLGRFDALAPADQAHYEATAGRDKRIMTAYLRGNMHALPAEDRQHFQSRFMAAASEGTNSAGGYTVAPLYVRELLIAQKAFGGMRRVSRNIVTDTGATLPWPTMDDTSNVATILSSENVTVGTDTDLAFGTASVGAYTWKSGVLLVSLQLLQDSAFDFDSVIQGRIAERFARGQNTKFTKGAGTTEPFGVLTNAAAGYTMPVGNTTSVTFDGLIELIHSVDPAYRTGAQFMFADVTLKSIRELKDSYGRYLWQPSYMEGIPDLILGQPYTINQDMPVMAANAKPILYGNFSNYIIRDVLDMQMMVLRERYADFLQVGYIAFSRADGRLVSAASPIKYLANSAT